MTKRDFKQAAMTFMSQTAEAQPEEHKTITAEETPRATAREAKAPEGYKLNPKYVETKSQRLQLLIQPSTQRALKEQAELKGISVNELANLLLKAGLNIKEED